jgi:uncharacterized membrane protein
MTSGGDVEILNHLTHIITQEKRELTALERRVVTHLKQGKPIAMTSKEMYEENRTTGEKAADAIARFGGSWTFVITFFVFMLSWITLNAVMLINPFDPYPYILLNLILSTIAALQAPIIMMSQNRQEARDRIRAEHDYLINIKAEHEIRQMKEKIDFLVKHQMEKLLQIEKLQSELIQQKK